MTDPQLLPLGDSYHQLASEFRNKLAGQCSIKRCAKGDVLLQQGDEQDAGYLIVSGVLGALHASSQGVQKCKEFYF